MLRLFAGGARALAEEAYRLWSSKIDGDDYSGDGSYDSTYETHAAPVEDLSYSEPYRDDVDYDARHPSPSCPSVESGAECEAEDSEYDDYDREGEGSRGYSSKHRGASKEGKQASRGGDDRDYCDTNWSLRLRRRGLHQISTSRWHDKPIGQTSG